MTRKLLRSESHHCSYQLQEQLACTYNLELGIALQNIGFRAISLISQQKKIILWTPRAPLSSFPNSDLTLYHLVGKTKIRSKVLTPRKLGKIVSAHLKEIGIVFQVGQSNPNTIFVCQDSALFYKSSLLGSKIGSRQRIKKTYISLPSLYIMNWHKCYFC